MVKLLTTNAKLLTAIDYGYMALGAQLLPGNKSGKEFCHDRGACFATCLDESGRGNMPNVKNARLWRSNLWNDHPTAYIDFMHAELYALERDAEKQHLKPACRLNTFSDIPWEDEAPSLFRDHPGVQFYDYTKSPDRARMGRKGLMPPNYDLTYSWSEKATGQFGSMHLKHGGKIAIVGRDHDSIPQWMSRMGELVNGDEHDLIFLHPPGSVQVLTPKGKLKKNQTNFA